MSGRLSDGPVIKSINKSKKAYMKMYAKQKAYEKLLKNM